MHLVGRSKVIRTIKKGGLGLYNSHFRNLTCVTKLSWRFLNEKNKPWVNCLYSNYVHNKSKPKTLVSPTWKAMRETYTFMDKGIRWVTYNGRARGF